MTAKEMLKLGPDNDAWFYDRSSKTYDLTRGGGSSSSSSYTVATSRGPPATSLRIDPARTALVVIDMQNYFLDAKLRNHETGLAAVPPTLDVIAKCRKLGIQVKTTFSLSCYIPSPCFSISLCLSCALSKDSSYISD
jgi:phosphatidylethanolamine-binding protein